MKESIFGFFKGYEFVEWNEFRYREEFDLALINNYEAYLIKIFNHVPTIEEIRYLEQFVYEYIVRLPNENSLKYNISLVIGHAFDKTPKALIMESDKYTCRKYFLNTTSIETLNKDFTLLPFVDIDVASDHSDTESLDKIIERKLGQALYSVLTNKEFKADDILKLKMEN